MHPLLWQLLQLLIHQARDLHEPGEPNPEYTRGQVNLITDSVGLGDPGRGIYEILTSVITHQTGEIDGLMELQKILAK